MAKIYLFRTLAVAAAMAAISPLSAQQWSVEPAAGNFPGPITEVKVTFEEGVSDIQFSDRALLYYNPSEKADNTGIIYFNGDAYVQEVDNYGVRVDDNVVTFFAKSQNGVWDAKDKYDLRIPAGAITYMYKGVRTSCPDINVMWYISDFPNIAVSPAPGDVDDLSSFTISLPDGFSVASSYFAIPAQFGPRIFLADAWGEPVGNNLAFYKLAAGVSATDIKGGQTMEFEGPIVRGTGVLKWEPVHGTTYVVTVLKSSFTILQNSSGSTEFVPKTNFVYRYMDPNIDPDNSGDITGVSTLADDDSFTVVTVDGRVVAVGATQEEVRALTPGLYIVNGKKLMVRP
ncbi:MAG: hypothetical protein K2L83_02920 [Muribaculaceae bacterium]|nr:hypothetical protein [Muribaculaceae bacterium]